MQAGKWPLLERGETTLESVDPTLGTHHTVDLDENGRLTRVQGVLDNSGPRERERTLRTR